MAEIDIFGKKFAITGTLPIVRSEAIATLEKMGGTYKTTVTRDTNYLIVGELRNYSHKLERAQKLQQAGHPVILVDGRAIFSGNSY